MELDTRVYDGRKYVSVARSVQLFSSEGFGYTSHAGGGRIVDKVLRPETFKILVVGDSLTKAVQVSDGYKYTEVVERRWNEAHPERPIQTINMAVGGDDMPSFLTFGRNMDREYQPDLVFALLTRLDFRPLRDAPPLLEKVAAGVREPLVPRANESAFTEFINACGVRSFFGKLEQQIHGFWTGREVTGRLRSAGGPFQPPTDPRSTDVQLAALRDIWGDRLVIVWHVNIGNLGRDVAPPPAQNECSILQRVKASGIPLIDLYPRLWSALRERKPPTGFNNSLLGRGHYNRSGHELVAEAILEFLETRR